VITSKLVTDTEGFIPGGGRVAVNEPFAILDIGDEIDHDDLLPFERVAKTTKAPDNHRGLDVGSETTSGAVGVPRSELVVEGALHLVE
jgi:hypothetical protein